MHAPQRCVYQGPDVEELREGPWGALLPLILEAGVAYGYSSCLSPVLQSNQSFSHLYRVGRLPMFAMALET